MKVVVFVYQLGVLLSTLVGVTHPKGYHEAPDWPEDECSRTLREATSVKIETHTPPKLSGHWTSYRCETRPGPEFVLRKYLFRRHSFNAQIYYYADDACTIITHSYTAKGTVRPARISWRTPGAYEAKYRLSQVVAISYTKDQAKVFEKIVHRYCKLSKTLTIKPYRKFKIFQFTKYSKYNPEVDDSDFDCLKIFNFTMNELQLMRVEKRHLSKTHLVKNTVNSKVKSQGQIETELFLGDVSTNMKYRQHYRPTYYQTPLKKSKTKDCATCATIANSNQWQPPTLHSSHVTSTNVVGDWVSIRCEARPNGQYLTRSLTFLSDNRSWSGVYEFYKDPLCREPSFSLDLKGNLFQEQRSGVVPSVNDYVFRTTKLKVTARDFQMVQYLNSYQGNGCGKSKKWKIGVTQDVTASNGCVTLGIQLPNIEYEIMKTESIKDKTFLFVGQRPSDFVTMSVRKNRPTSFQSPLVKCNGSKSSSSFNSLPQIKNTSTRIHSVSMESPNSQTLQTVRYDFVVSSQNLTMQLTATNTGIHVQFHTCLISMLCTLHWLSD